MSKQQAATVSVVSSSSSTYGKMDAEGLQQQRLAESLHLMSTRYRDFHEVQSHQCTVYSFFLLILFFLQISEHLEEQFLSAKRIGSAEQSDIVMAQAKSQIAEALSIVVEDIQTMTAQFDDLLRLQERQVLSVDCQVSVLSDKLHAMRSQHLHTALLELQTPLPENTLWTPTTSSTTTTTAIQDLPESEVVVPKHLRR
jgi:hypothetical protein